MLWACVVWARWGRGNDGDCEKDGGRNCEVWGLLNMQNVKSQMFLDTEETPSHSGAYGRILTSLSTKSVWKWVLESEWNQAHINLRWHGIYQPLWGNQPSVVLASLGLGNQTHPTKVLSPALVLALCGVGVIFHRKNFYTNDAGLI